MHMTSAAKWTMLIAIMCVTYCQTRSVNSEQVSFTDVQPKKVNSTLLSILSNHDLDGHSNEQHGRWCPDGFIYMRYADGCYKPVAERLPWELADFKCQTIHKDAHLVFINSFEEQFALQTLLPYFAVPMCIWRPRHDGKYSWWTGGQRIDTSSRYAQFAWKTSSPDCKGCAPAIKNELTYRNWLPGQPDFALNYSSPESCLILHSGYQYRWNDLACLESNCFVCELDQVRI